jgi:hypothetical protein
MSFMAKSALLVFVKEPIEGKVKTRLAASIGEADATELYKTFIVDSFKQYQSLSNTYDLHYYYSPSCKILKALLPDQKNWHAQKGADLGERMANAIAEQLKVYSTVVLVGSDHPDLPLSYLKKAADVLNYVDISIGPSDDGGYYCIGMKKDHPRIFANITWSTKNVFQETKKRFKANQLEAFELPQWYDIDTIEDLERYKKNNAF